MSPGVHPKRQVGSTSHMDNDVGRILTPAPVPACREWRPGGSRPRRGRQGLRRQFSSTVPLDYNRINSKANSMPKLTITNLLPNDQTIQDATGLSGFSVRVPASATVSNVAITEDGFILIQDLLAKLATAGRITWSVKEAAGDVASIGDRSLGYSYVAGQATWIDIDGVNPPTVGGLC